MAKSCEFSVTFFIFYKVFWIRYIKFMSPAILKLCYGHSKTCLIFYYNGVLRLKLDNVKKKQIGKQGQHNLKIPESAKKMSSGQKRLL